MSNFNELLILAMLEFKWYNVIILSGLVTAISKFAAIQRSPIDHI